MFGGYDSSLAFPIIRLNNTFEEVTLGNFMMTFGMCLIDFDSDFHILLKELKPPKIKKGNSPSLINVCNLNPSLSIISECNSKCMLIKLYNIILFILLSRIITAHHLIKCTINKSLLSIIKLS